MGEHYLERLLKELKLNAKQFAESIGLDRADKIYHVLNGRNGVSSDLANKIRIRYPNVRYEWLMGDGGNVFMTNPLGDSGNKTAPPEEKEMILVSREAWTIIKKQANALERFAESAIKKDEMLDKLVSTLTGNNVGGDFQPDAARMAAARK